MDVAVIGTTGQSITFTLPPFRFKGLKRTEKKNREKTHMAANAGGEFSTSVLPDFL